MQKTKKEIIESLRTNSKDVGSSEVQIGLLSEKINNLATHFKKIKMINILQEAWYRQLIKENVY